VAWDIRGTTLDFFAKTFLGIATGRPVFNRTGLTGLYDVKMEFGVDETTPGSADTRAARDPDTAADAAPEPLGPSLFTALQQQLGLKLETTRGPAEFLVIDHIERPSGN